LVLGLQKEQETSTSIKIITNRES